MRLFSRREKHDLEHSAPERWVPNYLIAPSSGRSFLARGLGYARRVVSSSSSKRPSTDQVEVMTWGKLSREECAQMGLEALIGMVSVRHGEQCPHFWCSLPRFMDMVMVVEFFLSGVLDESSIEDEKPADEYIGAYLFPMQHQGSCCSETQNGPIYPRKPPSGVSACWYDEGEPALKLIVQPWSDGNLTILKGRPTQKHVPSFDGKGAIDPNTRETLWVAPKRMPQVIEDPTSSDVIPRFLFGYDSSDGLWYVMRILSHGTRVPISNSGSVQGYSTFEAHH